MRIQVKDFMSHPVITAVENTKIGEIKALMNRHKIHSIPIISYTKKLPEADTIIKGIITSHDLSDTTDSTLAKDLMSSKVHIIHKNSSAQSAASMMLKQKVHHLVVMDEGEITGMISSLDFVKLVSEHKLD